ncbi:hypothetical protein SOVF_053620 isoform B [Spinacia oleracea]|nr:hypothetical protein SOVF_053620 isoform B [Spinacia oleracea]
MPGTKISFGFKEDWKQQKKRICRGKVHNHLNLPEFSWEEKLNVPEF